jgi:methanogenic corrinoid protein MtbC1
MEKKARILAGLEHAVVSGRKEESKRYAANAIRDGVPAMEAIDSGLIKGMTIIGDRYAQHKIFLHFWKIRLRPFAKLGNIIMVLNP